MLEKGFDFLRRKLMYEDKVFNLLAPHISGKVLSIGCGQGIIEERLRKETGADISGVEVTRYNEHRIPTKHYDGKSIPFPRKSFDTSMMVYMLHHLTNVEEMLSEAKRVARKEIIILDHAYANQVAKGLLMAYDYFSNLPYRMPMPLNFLRVREWKSIFDRLGLRIVEAEVPAKLNIFFKLRC